MRPIRTIPLRPAFTLVEVLVVVVVMAIAGAVVVPSMLNASRLGSQGAARQLISDILIAQSEAIAAQEPRRIQFWPMDLDGNIVNGYALQDGDGNPLQQRTRGGGSAPWIMNFDTNETFEGVILERVFPEDSSPPATLIEFDDLGSPGAPVGQTAATTVILRSDAGRYRVSVAPITGRVTVEELGLGADVDP